MLSHSRTAMRGYCRHSPHRHWRLASSSPEGYRARPRPSSTGSQGSASPHTMPTGTCTACAGVGGGGEEWGGLGHSCCVILLPLFHPSVPTCSCSSGSGPLLLLMQSKKAAGAPRRRAGASSAATSSSVTASDWP